MNAEMPKWIFQKNWGDQQGGSMLIDISEMLSCGRRKSNGFDLRRKKPQIFWTKSNKNGNCDGVLTT